MCGIAGWAGRVAADEEVLSRMRAAIAHRGPDDDASLIRPGRVALGFRRLSIIDLECGAQPLHSEDGQVSAMCNGEIYNFQSLRSELQARGHRFETGSDAEVIVHAYEEHGLDCLDELRGMFALAVWDERAGRLL